MIKSYYASIILLAIAVGLIVYSFFKKNAIFSGKNIFNRKGTASILNSFSIDFTARAARGQMDPVIGRQDEVLRLAQILSRRTKNNAVLIGSAGVGKTAIVEGLAQR